MRKFAHSSWLYCIFGVAVTASLSVPAFAAATPTCGSISAGHSTAELAVDAN